MVSGHGDGDKSFVKGGSSSFADVSLLDQNVSMNNLSLYHMDPCEIYSAHRDTDAQLKAAFIFHVKNQLVGYRVCLSAHNNESLMCFFRRIVTI